MTDQDAIQANAEIPGVDETTLMLAEATQSAATILKPASGLYTRKSPAALPALDEDAADTTPAGPVLAGAREELRIDIDGNDPQRVASGVIYRALNSRVNWIAKLAPAGVNTWTGTIWYKDGDIGTFPSTTIKLLILRSGSGAPSRAKVIYSGGGAPNAERTYSYSSPYFRHVEFEFDAAQNAAATIQMQTHAHPNRPANLPNENLTIRKVFQRAGFGVNVLPGGSVPIVGAGSNGLWSDSEMHDAMQTYWSRFGNRANWSLWVFYAAMHETGSNLGGIMFDDIGSNHRQGTAIFHNSFIAQAPVGDAAPAAWVNRMRFWCACHEMGHAFNLAHSWQKALGTPWIPLSNELEARSFMNYPYRVAGGPTAFFNDFQYRFSNDELLFMRHAPERYVQMGNAAWFDHHAFQQANVLAEPNFALSLRANRTKCSFEFMEPVVLELKLTNVSSQPQLVDAKVLSPSEHMTVIVKKKGKEARQILPFAEYCWRPELQAMAPGQTLYESLFTAVGRGGWEISEPGDYLVQVALHLETEDVVSNPIQLRVTPPRNYNEEVLAQDFFADDVGRTLSFDGSQTLVGAVTTLHEVAAQLPKSRAAIHAQVALASPMMRENKQLAIGAAAESPDPRRQISATPADLDMAKKELSALLQNEGECAETLGHIDYNYYVSRLGERLAAEGRKGEAQNVLDTLIGALTERNVAPRVIKALSLARDAIGKGEVAGVEMRTVAVEPVGTKAR